MHSVIRKPVIIALLAFFWSSCGDPNQPDRDLSGRWEGTITGYTSIKDGESPLIVEIFQDNRNIEGSVIFPEASRVHAIDSGVLDEIVIRFNFNHQGQVTAFTGTLRGNSLEGTWRLVQDGSVIEDGRWQTKLMTG
jgi:hypothetical protein